MPIHDCPLTYSDGGSLVAYLPITIINPHTGKSVLTQGLIDTGADECSIPSGFAKKLGHVLKDGYGTEVVGCGGTKKAWAHTTKILIHHPLTGDLIYSTPDVRIDYISGLTTVLLGVNSFLSKFNINMNYINNTFSVLRSFRGP
jgi:predicted aspartyl protease